MNGTAELLPWYLRQPQSRRLLVVAEDPKLRETLLRGLTRQEFTVIALSSAELPRVLGQASPEATEPDFHLVVTDVGAGQAAHGLRTVKTLREGGLQVPVLCLATASDRNALSADRGLAPLAVVLKPIDIQEVGSEASRLIHLAEDSRQAAGGS